MFALQLAKLREQLQQSNGMLESCKQMLADCVAG